MNTTISIMYHDPDMPRLKMIDKGNWIDLYTTEEVDLKAGDFKLISLGVSMQLPEGHEAIIAPRSSTFKKTGIIQANQIGIIDNSFAGPEDQWRFPAYATRDVHVDKYTRLCQFRIQEAQPKITFNEVETLAAESRGGFGSTDKDGSFSE